MQVVEGEGWKGALETSSAEPVQNVTIHTKALPASVCAFVYAVWKKAQQRLSTSPARFPVAVAGCHPQLSSPFQLHLWGAQEQGTGGSPASVTKILTYVMLIFISEITYDTINLKHT